MKNKPKNLKIGGLVELLIIRCCRCGSSTRLQDEAAQAAREFWRLDEEAKTVLSFCGPACWARWEGPRARYTVQNGYRATGRAKY